VVFGTPVFLQLGVELEVAHCAEFLLGRGRAEPGSAQFRRVWSMNWTIPRSRRVVYIAGLQQIIFNADSSILERVIRDQGRTQVSLSARVSTSLLGQYVLRWTEETLSVVVAFALQGNTATRVSKRH